MLVHIREEISRPVFLSVAGTIRAFVRHRAEAGYPHDDWSPSNFGYPGSVWPPRQGGIRKKIHGEIGGSYTCLQSLFELWLSKAHLALLRAAADAEVQQHQAQAESQQPGACTVHGGKHSHPTSCRTRASWSSAGWYTPWQGTLLASGTDLILKSRIACCSSLHPKSLLVPAIHTGGHPARW